MSSEAKQEVLWALIPRLDAFEALVEYGRERICGLCDERGVDWDSMTEHDRERLIDELLHEGGA